MKNLINGILMVLILASGTALAAGNAPARENSLAVMLFLAFLALLIVMQLVPGIMLFASMIKGLFTRTARPSLAADKESAE